MTKVASVTLGCKLNYAETSSYERGLRKSGWITVPWTDPDVDWFIVNTCTVTEHSDKKSRNIIRKLHRMVPGAGIVVTGCSAQLRRTEIEALGGVVRVFGANEKAQLVPFMLGLEASVEECGFFNAWSIGERTRSFLKVQDGCDFKCAYCTVPYARGESRSARICELVAEARQIASEGIREIVLTGVNTGDFGRNTGENFLDLLKALDAVDGIERYRISSIEPNLLTAETVEWIASGTKFLPHFHIPLQCGCDSVLERMGRRYRCADFAAKTALIRRMMEAPGRQKVFFGIDVIAGFPGETQDEFAECLRFLAEDIRPAFLHVFPYSRRPGTVAATMPRQVQDSVKTTRCAALEELSARLHTEFLEANRGLGSKVLYEEYSGGNVSGWSENYIRVVRPGSPSDVNTIENIEL